MKNRLFLPFITLFYWLLVATVLKTVFVVYQIWRGQALSFSEYLQVLQHGFPLDLSMSGYFTIFPLILVLLSTLIATISWKRINYYYTVTLLTLLLLLSVIDLELYVAWGYRLDVSFLRYFNTPSEMLASAGSSPVLLLCSIYLTLLFLTVFIHYRYINPLWDKREQKEPKVNLKELVITLVYGVVLVIPIRGGLNHLPISESEAYFSNRVFLNHAAVNMPWTFFRSITNDADVQLSDLHFMDEDRAKSIAQKMYTAFSPDSILLNTSSPNIVLIVWESLAHQVSDTGATPQFNKLKHQGIYFSNFYGNADRSDKGLVSILSGHPAIPGISLMQDPRRTAQMNSIPKSLQKIDYQESTFIYGGNMAFANMRSYMTEIGFRKIIDESSFEPRQRTSKWGAHDEYTFDKLTQEVQNTKGPFFITLFTISSHEPYDVPTRNHYADSEESSLFMNAHQYTDSCLYVFIDKLQQTALWKNTLVIIVGDHGHRLPRHTYFHNNDSTEFHTEMLWLGGALKYRGITNNHFGSQTDIATTLLHQLQINADEYIYGKDLLSKASPNFAQYSFRDGFGFVSPSGAWTYDRNNKSYTPKSKAILTSERSIAEACMQFLIQNYRIM